jgi:hypothetical protein
MFTRSGWSVVRSVSLAKGATSKKRPSPHLYKVPTRSNIYIYIGFEGRKVVSKADYNSVLALTDVRGTQSYVLFM